MEETLILEVSDGRHVHACSGDFEPVYVDASVLDSTGWEALVTRCSQLESPPMHLIVNRNLLEERSTYFRSLIGGYFRDSSQHHVKVVWDMATCCSLVQSMCLGNTRISSFNLQQLLEGAAFFGMEEVMHSVVLQLKEETLSVEMLKCISGLWNLTKEIGLPLVAHAFVEILVINFDELIRESGVQTIHFSLFLACLEEIDLTIESEKALCKAMLDLILIYTHPSEPSMNADCRSHCLETHIRGLESEHELPISAISMMLEKVRALLLPVDFIVGHFPLDFMLDMPLGTQEGVRALLLLVKEVGNKRPSDIIYADSDELTPRLTRYSKRLDLSGCQQITCAVLFRAALHYLRKTNSMDSEEYIALASRVDTLLCDEMLVSSEFTGIGGSISFLNLSYVNLAKCWRLHQEKLVIWLWLVCPNLKNLNISNCPQLHINIIPQIANACMDLEALDLSLDARSLPGLEYSIHEENNIVNYRLYKSQQQFWSQSNSLSRLTHIFLQGRSSLTDSDLQDLSQCCPNISAFDLRGCSQLTDIGISKFLEKLNNLRAVGAALTKFGPVCIKELVENYGHSQPSSHKDTVSSKPLCKWSSLLKLDLEGCHDLDIDSLAKLLDVSFDLSSLNLATVRVGDDAIVLFRGTSLQELNLRETQVSWVGLAPILSRSPNLKTVNIRGCKSLMLPLSIDNTPQRSSHPACCMLSTLHELAIGWGLSDFTLQFWRPYLLKKLVVGLGARITEEVYLHLFEYCPFLVHLSLCCQVVYGESFMLLLNKMQKLQVLELEYCLGDVPSHFIKVITTNLVCLRLERGVSWMQDTDLYLLGTQCKKLHQLSLVGCKLLTPRSLETIACLWCGMTILKLEECGIMTLKGASALFGCMSLQHLTLRHTGCGLQSDFLLEAMSRLPLLQGLSLDYCDFIQDFEVPPLSERRRLLNHVDIVRCEVKQNSINGVSRRMQKGTLILEWDDLRLRSFGLLNC